jgi:hypothetical protein
MREKPMADGLQVAICKGGHVVLLATDEDGNLLSETHMPPSRVQEVVDDLIRARDIARALAEADAPWPAAGTC